MKTQKRDCRHRPWVRSKVARCTLGVLLVAPVGLLCVLAGSPRVGASGLSRPFASVPSGFRLRARTRVSLPLSGPPPFPGEGPDLPQWVHRRRHGAAGLFDSGLGTESTRTTSSHWSGIIDIGTTYTAVSGDWTVPWPYASASTAHVGTWVGISGISHTTTLIQTGVAATVTGDSVTYRPWYELIPASPIGFSEPVSHGDEMRGVIEQEGPQTWYIALEDVTKGWVATRTVTYTASPANSAEWITERPRTGTTGSLTTLADYGSTTFHDLRLNGADLTASGITYAYMQNTTGTIISYPSNLITDTFTDTYGTPSTRVTPPTISSISPASGPTSGGTTVTITGSNFTGASSVGFGSTAASFRVTGPTTITATSPPGTGTVYVTVTTPGGTSAAASADRFTFVTPPPTVSSLSPDTGLAAGGTVVTITGSNLTGASSVDFGATPAASFRVTGSTHITATSPAGTGTVNVTVKTPGGTSAVASDDQFTYQAPSPTVYSVSPSQGPTSGGTTVTITGSNFTGASSVGFGSTAASFRVTGPTTITATSPTRLPGLVYVTVTTPGGKSAPTNFGEFTYSTPMPVVGSLTRRTGPTAGGTIVTITGANFVRGARVRFGATVARSVQVMSATRIEATSPAHTSGSVNVTVTTRGGTSRISPSDRFDYLAPRVTSVSPRKGPVRMSVTIIGANFVRGARVWFGTRLATHIVVVSPTRIVVRSPIGKGTVRVTVTIPGGTSAPTHADLFTYS